MVVVVGQGFGPAVVGRSPTQAVPAGFTFHRQQSGLGASKKLTKWSVADIRRWARTDGYGLTPRQQADALVPEFSALVSQRALWEVLTNRSWYDPNYDPSLPLELPTNLPPEWLGWFLSVLIMWRSMCFVIGGPASVPVALTRSK